MAPGTGTWAQPDRYSVDGLSDRHPMPDAYRGKLFFHAELCVGCKLCQKDCSAGALEIRKVGDERYEAEFRFDRCIYCAQCADSCNKDAIVATPEYELATLDRATLRVVYPAPPPPAIVAAPAVAEAAAEAAVPAVPAAG
jgi:formate hydrogenlyase subunit 6/NADH:ubiquinone oxidoreductase subunit I